jgi:multidrug efflux pump subunit AcrB
MLPIAVSTGIGSENRAGIGIASVGGIIVAGILTLTVMPLVYTLTTGRSKTHPTPPEPKREA